MLAKEPAAFLEQRRKKLGWDGRQEPKRQGSVSEKKAEQNAELLRWSSCSQAEGPPESQALVCVPTCSLQAWDDVPLEGHTRAKTASLPPVFEETDSKQTHKGTEDHVQRTCSRVQWAGCKPSV